jgi:hypothetical protein
MMEALSGTFALSPSYPLTALWQGLQLMERSVSLRLSPNSVVPVLTPQDTWIFIMPSETAEFHTDIADAMAMKRDDTAPE